MRAAFHFKATSFGSMYGRRSTVLLFRQLIACIAPERRHVVIRRGDLLLWGVVETAEDIPAFVRRLLGASRPLWTTTEPDDLAGALRESAIWVLAMDGTFTPADAVCIDSQLRQVVGYLGAVEIHLGNPVHWGLYDRKLPAVFRIVGNELRLLHVSADLDPESRDEAVRRQWSETGMFERVEWEDTGLRDTVFDDFSDYGHAKRVADIEDRLGDQFGPLVSEVLLRLGTLDPRLPDSIHAAATSLALSESVEQLAHVSLSCRRFLGSLADALYPPRPGAVRGHKVGPSEYRNRLWAYIEANFEATERTRVLGSFEELGNRLDRIDETANKQIHSTAVERDEANRLILALVVWAHDVLTLTPPPRQTRVEPYLGSIGKLVERIKRRSGRDSQ